MKYKILFTFLFTLTLISAQSLRPFQIDSLFGYKNVSDKIVIKPQFQYASKFIYDYAVVAKNEKFGIINSRNDQLIDYKYEFLMPLDSSEVLYGKRGKYFGEFLLGVLTLKEEIKIQDIYSSIEKKNRLYIVQLDDSQIISKDENGAMRKMKSKYGLLDSDGKILIPCNYSNITWKTSKILDVSKDLETNDHALFNIEGKQITDFGFMVFGDFKDGLAKARIDNKFGFIDENGKIIIPIKYDYCNEFEDGFSIIESNKKYGAINTKGKIIIEPLYEFEIVKKKLEENIKQ
ncbi:WG repeat-containing protein [Epilithonimonas lactis]|uniref:WG containing repeat-containing protein n=1 Tax=Epilithonimonas lactis TaxID=421072 RepID=A0A085BMQ2_9FLAO|nr:WG repeat-containing protein [Epilithonimonas lactis]KFC23747.1 hypothetical protein IO89_04035 [Epilithonimonas lactis]SEQ23812.1 WG containing repeat-containing protein [Epilithonimonas lactis]